MKPNARIMFILSMAKIAFICSSIILLLGACLQPLADEQLRLQSPLHTPPLLVKHPKPDLPLIDTRVFSDTLRIADPVSDAAKKKYGQDAQSIGTCDPIDFNQPYWAIEREKCPWTLAMTQTECDRIMMPNPLWGGLEPRYPIALCAVSKYSLRRNIKNTEFFYARGGFDHPFYRYVVYKEGSLTEIHTIEELQALYAPIVSADEALSYALVATGLEADFRDSLEGDLKYYHFYVTRLENTYVKLTNDGYQVLLYHSTLPCTVSHVTTEVVTVMTDGRIIRGAQQAAYDLDNGLCVD